MRNISINEGGVTRNFTTAMLQTDLKEGGTCRWVNPNDILLGSLYASENGLYTIKKEEAYPGYYGFGNISVSVPGENRHVAGYDPDLDKIVAVGPDSAGNMTISDMPAIVSPDCIGPNGIPQFNQYGAITGTDLNGNPQAVVADDDGVHLTNLPTRIEVTTMPTKTQYSTGQNLNFSGMVVTAYYADGTVWGTIPVGQIVPSRRKAEPLPEESESAYMSDVGDVVKQNQYIYLDEDNQITIHNGYWRYNAYPPYNYGDPYYVENERPYTAQGHRSSDDDGVGEVGVLIRLPHGDINPDLGPRPGTVVSTYDQVFSVSGIRSSLYTDKSDGWYNSRKYYVRNNKCVEFCVPSLSGLFNNLVVLHERTLITSIDFFESNVEPLDLGFPQQTGSNTGLTNDEKDRIAKLFWEILYGDAIILIEITLYWQRPGDKEILSTQITLDIVV